MQIGRDARTSYTYYRLVYRLLLIGSIFTQATGMLNALDLGFLSRTASRSEIFLKTKTENVEFYAKKSSDSDEKMLRKGILTKRPGAKGTILICHGYMCDKFDVTFIRTFFPDYNCMAFDFRAHGEKSDDEYCTMGKEEAYDVIGAAEFLKNHPAIKGQKIFGYGFSMGAASLIEAQAKKPLFDALILDCPFDSSETIIQKGIDALTFEVFGYKFDMPCKKLLQKYAYNPYMQPLIKTIFKAVARLDGTRTNTQFCHVVPAESVKKINVPCFFIHCRNDEKISVKQVKKVYGGAGGYKRLWITNGRRHFDSIFYNPEQYIARTNDFLSEVLTGAIYAKPKDKIIEDKPENS